MNQWTGSCQAWWGRLGLSAGGWASIPIGWERHFLLAVHVTSARGGPIHPGVTIGKGGQSLVTGVTGLRAGVLTRGAYLSYNIRMRLFRRGRL
jgi:hypothetical protein